MGATATQTAFEAVVEQARNLIDAHERRNPDAQDLTLNERQELAVLFIRLDDYRETNG